jgi:hypothetical protein
MRIRIALVALALVATASGCGTVHNFARPRPRLYGGVAWDLEPHEIHYTSSGHRPVASFLTLLVAAPVVWCGELCLSAAADTVTLPLVVFVPWPEDGA